MFRAVQIPESYVPLVIGYLAGLMGGSREASTREFIVLDDSECNCRN